jgi:hypothetical protein
MSIATSENKIIKAELQPDPLKFFQIKNETSKSVYEQFSCGESFSSTSTLNLESNIL